MNPNREEVLFALVLEKPAEKRSAFLDAMCEATRFRASGQGKAEREQPWIKAP